MGPFSSNASIYLTWLVAAVPREMVNFVSNTVSQGKGQQPESNFVKVEGKLNQSCTTYCTFIVWLQTSNKEVQGEIYGRHSQFLFICTNIYQ